MINITKFISNNNLNKTINIDGSKISNAQFYSGSFKTIKIKSLDDVQNIIENLNSNEAIGLGINKYNDYGDITTQSEDKLKSRIKDNFEWNSQKHLVLLDYDYFDGLKKISSPSEYRDTLIDIDPIFENVAMLILPSSSSGIYYNDSLLIDSKGLHCYIIIDGDINDFKSKLWNSCWSKGYGKIKFSKSGSILSRTIFDKTIFSPERLIFENQPILEKGLTKKELIPYKTDGISLFVDKMHTNTSIGKKVEEIARFQAKSESKKKEKEYINKESNKLIKKGMKKEEARSLITARCVNSIIFNNQIITLLDGSNIKASQLTMKHNGLYCLDPIEPSKSHAIININDNGTKSIWSFLHGGRMFFIQQPYLVTDLKISDEAKILAQGYRSNKWINEYGNFSNDEMFENWNILFQSFLNASKPDFLNKMYLLGVGAGNGKSTTLGYYIAKKIIPEKKSALIVVTTIQAAIEMKESINNILFEDGINTIQAKTLFGDSKKGIKSDINNKEADNTEILIITHNKLQFDLSNNENETIRKYHKNDRDLIVIDEAIDFSETATINIDRLQISIAHLDSYIRQSSNKEAIQLKNIISHVYNKLIHLEKNNQVFDATEIFGSHININISDNLKQILTNITADFNMAVFIKDLEILSHSENFTIDTGQLGYFISSSVDKLPKGKGVVILDASASINHEYNHYISNRKAERIKINEKAKSYNNVNIHYNYIEGITGKLNPNSNDPSHIQVFKDRKLNIINEINDKTTPNDNVLIIANKSFIQDIQTLIFPNRNIQFGYWGNLTGRNDLRNTNKIFILSLPYKPIIKSKNTTHKHNVLGDVKEEKLFKNTNIIDDVYQALMRGILRTTEKDTANAPSCDIYMVLPTNRINFTDKLKTKLSYLLFGSQILTWNFFVNKDNTSLFNVAPLYKASETLTKISNALNQWDKYNGDKVKYIPIKNLNAIADIKDTAITNALKRKIGYGVNLEYSGLQWVLDNSDGYIFIDFKHSKQFLLDKGIKVHGRVGNIFYKNIIEEDIL